MGGFTFDKIVYGDRVWESIGGPPHHMLRAHKLVGGDFSVVSPVGEDFDIWSDFEIRYTRFIEVFYGYQTIRFINEYTSSGRRQIVSGGGYQLSVVNAIDFLERVFPDDVIISPVYHEIPVKLVKGLSNLFDVSLDVQGFIRESDEKGSIYHIPLKEELYDIPYKLFKLSNEESPYVDLDRVDAQYKVVTNGREGSVLIFEDSMYHIPAYRLEDVDETGSGDIYTYLFLLGLKKFSDPVDAACYASAITSCVLEGLSSIENVWIKRFDKVRSGVKQLK